MFLMHILFLSITTMIYTAEVTLEFSDNESTTALSDALMWSTTIKSMFEELGTNYKNIPIHNTTKATFDCLQDLMIEKKDPLEFTNPKIPLDEIRKKFVEKLNVEKYKEVNRRDLYLAAHYLNPHDKFRNVLASFYVDTFEKSPPQIKPQENNYPIFDNIPLDAHKFIAGWLLHNLLNAPEIKPIAETKDVTFTNNEIDIGPILSSSGSHRSFACIWKQQGGEGSLESALLNSRYLILDLSKEGITQNNSFYSMFGDKAFCEISQDNKYMIAITRRGRLSQIFLYNVSQETVKKQKKKPYQVLYLPHNLDRIISVLFDYQNNVFKVITFESKVDVKKDTADKTFYCYTIDPTAITNGQRNAEIVTKIIDDKRVQFHFHNMLWNCINGKLIGVYTTYEGDTIKKVEAIIYDDKKLLECFPDNDTDGAWFYETDEGKKVTYFNLVKKDSNYLAIQQSFIPEYGKIISKKLQNITDSLYLGKSMSKLNPRVFDPHNLHMNFIRNDLISYYGKIGIYYPYDQRLVAAINIINQKMLTGYPLVLFDAYFLYEFHTKPTKWHIRCKHLINPKKMFISLEIQKIYGLDQLITNPLQPEKPRNFWDAYKHGKLWEYTKQQFQTYKKQILYGSTAIGGAGIAAWLWRKSKVPNIPTSPQPTQPANRPLTSAGPGDR